MKLRLLIAVLFLVGAFAAFGGVACGEDLASERPVTALVWVGLPTGDAIARFQGLDLPVYARLDRALLIGADSVGLDRLAESGISHRVLDTDIADIVQGRTEERFYFAFAPPGRPSPEWSSYGRVLLSESRQVLLRALPADMERLRLEGARVRCVHFDPKPVQAAASAAFSSALTPDPYIQLMMDLVDSSTLNYHVGDLSGAWPVTVGGGSYTIPTRSTYSGTPIQKATQFAGEYFQSLGLDVEYHEWGGSSYPNVIAELPGRVAPNDVFIICAHLDDVRDTPGADDNASGATAVMMAADIFRQYGWDSTLRFALWTGEEQGLDGSHAYAKRTYDRGENLLGVLNLDMIAWNSAGSSPDIDLIGNKGLAGSMQLADLFAQVVAAYNLNLVPQVMSDGSANSDHFSFWQYGYSAMLGIEDQNDFNPNYHRSGDLLSNLNLDYFNQFVKAAVGTFAHMSGAPAAETGALTVTIVPQAAVDAGAQWRLDGGEWQNSGNTLSDLAAGEHTVEFKQIPRWVRPFAKTVTITSDQTTATSGVYRSFRPMPPLALLLD